MSKRIFGKKNMGKKFKKLRLEQNKTQNQIAETIGITDKYLSNIENGNANCSLDVFIGLANEYNINADYLLSSVLTYDKTVKNNELQDIIYSELEAMSIKQKQYILDTIHMIKNSDLN